ncbi:ParB/RepB/Spo0J family partition protein [Lyngbya sp. CCY1209]|uniref:ParB/RepB/Spo0J family partition protein n=1 Tax=Lyngbya sp. CCY1209 TaxID=2886103 RepID=UPI002D20E667|nr:ParB/RepB/Spo0J family partition protein [Lyngbya sp. CCY1209]MEB3884084.1 ParB/RepB/Spo0J family partition protein [Lyngbya sp. CCY1209]
MTRKRDKPYNGSLGDKIDLLFGAPAAESESERTATTLPIAKLKPPDYQPRQHFDPDKLEELAETIRKHGILEPLLVRPVGDRYEIIAGGRRYRAAKLAGLTDVPVVVRELDNKQALELALLENVQREDLNPVEEAEGMLKLLEVRLDKSRGEVVSLLHRMRNEGKGKVTQNVLGSDEARAVEDGFAAAGLAWQSFVETKLALLNKPEDVLDAVRSGQLAYTKAMAIAQVKDESKRRELLEEAIAQKLSLSQIRGRITELRGTTEATEGETNETPEKRMAKLAKRAKVAKWDDPKKRRKLEKLLGQLEELFGGE